MIFHRTLFPALAAAMLALPAAAEERLDFVLAKPFDVKAAYTNEFLDRNVRMSK